MKKLKKLTLKDVENQLELLNNSEIESSIGGSAVYSDCTTWQEWSDGYGCDFIDNAILAIVTQVPGAGEVSQKVNCEAWELNTTFIEAGQDPNQCLTIDVIVDPNNVTNIYFEATDEYGNLVASTE